MPAPFRKKATRNIGGKAIAADQDITIKKLQAENRRLRAQLKLPDVEKPSALESAIDIKERNKTGKFLAESEKRYRNTLNSMMEGCQIIDYDWRYIYINDAAARQGRKAPDELLMHTMMEVYPGIEGTGLFNKIRLCMQDRVPQRMENQFFFSDGTFGWFELSIQPVPEGTFILSIDVTERRQAQLALRSSEENYRKLVENSESAIAVLDRNGGILYSNPRGISIWSDPQIVGKTIFDVYPDEYASRYGAAIKQVIDTQTSIVDEVESLINGRLMWFQLSMSPLKNPDGTVNTLVLNAFDITERKQAEEELYESEAKYRLIANNAEDWIYWIAPDGNFRFISPSCLQMTGYSPAEFTDHPKLIQEISHPESRQAVELHFAKIQKENKPDDLEYRIITKSGEARWISHSCSPIYTREGNYAGRRGTNRDITESKLAKMALAESEERFRGLYENATIGMYRTTPEGKILLANPALILMLGYSSFAELSQRDLEEEGYEPGYERNIFRRQIENYGQVTGLESAWKRKDGTIIFVRESARVARDAEGKIIYYEGTVEDITERKRAEQLLLESEERFRSFIEQSVDGIVLIDEHGIILEWNTAQEHLTGIPGTLAIGTPVWEIQYQILIPEHRAKSNTGLIKNAFFESFQSGKTEVLGKPLDIEIISTDGERKFLQQISFIIQTKAGNRVGSIFRDVSEQKQAEAESQALLEIMLDAARTENLQEFLKLIRQSLNKVIPAENFFVVFLDRISGMFEEVFAIDKYDAPMPPSKLGKSITSYVFRTGESLLLTQAKFEELKALGEVELIGTSPASWLGAPLKTPSETIGVIAVQDYENPDSYSERDRIFLASVAAQVALVIERKRSEDALRENDKRFRALIQNSTDAITLVGENGLVLYDSPAAPGMLGYSPEEWIGKDIFALMHPDDWPDNLKLFRKLAETPGSRISKTIQIRSRSGAWLWIEAVATNLLSEPGVKAIVLNYRDVTERKQAEEKIKLQLKYLTALKDIDRAISSTFDMRLSLDMLLSRAVSLLALDAAAVLLVNPNLSRLEFAAGLGFRTRALETVEIKLGEGPAGRAALEQRLIQIPNLALEPVNPRLSALLQGEKFVSFYGVPLIVKGKVIGVMELFHRTVIERDQEWLDFLETLAGQAAIAIDNAQMFDGLQRSNINLAMAYDATIVGWSRAMDMRDKETEGHTQRVADLTRKLAERMGSSPQELVHIRRGALLHDIGKLGVPDSILLKPEKLTAEEWDVMKRHPTYARDMLSSIPYLEPALSIPYCHHEKWDGTGYPQGLKGEQIPLAARMFAVTDVWDAITSDRPYRAAWSQEKALAYIRDESGRQFEPRIVDAFLSMITNS